MKEQYKKDVINALKEYGLTDTQIKNLITEYRLNERIDSDYDFYSYYDPRDIAAEILEEYGPYCKEPINIRVGDILKYAQEKNVSLHELSECEIAMFRIHQSSDI